MDSIIKRAFSPFAVALRAVVLTLVICATGGAWAAAPTPTVIWDGDFSSLSKTVGGVTYSINNIGNGNSVAADNSYLQVANSDNGYATPTITATGGDAPFGSTDGTTVIAFYREMPISQGSNRAVLSLLSADTYKNGHVHVGVYRDGPTGNTAAGFIISGQGSGTKTTNVFSGGEQMVAFSYKSDTGMMSYYVNGRKIASANSGVAAFTPTGVCLGGVDYTSSGTFYAMKGMKVLGVAIFNRELTAEEVAEFSFTKWDTSNKWRYNDTLAYREPTTGTASDFAYATVAMVGSDGVADTGTFALNSPSHHPYTVLNEPSGNYAFPGVALVFDEAGYKAPPAPNFGDMILGGLHVTANRAENTPYGLTSGTGGTRNTALGDKSGYRETYFVFDESFSISRQGSSGTGNSKLYGVVNIEVASGKEFSLNGNGETGNGATIVMTTAGTTAPVLRMAGGGKFKVGTLDASSGTLDFSGVTSAPFIQGGLTVTASTKLILPAGTAEDTSYVLNSTGTLTAPAVVQGATVQIGSGAEEEVILLYDTENRSVKYYRSFPEYNGTVSGSTITWDTEPTAEQMEVGIVNLTGSGEVTLSTEPFALDVDSGVTVDVTGYTSAALSGTGTFKYTSGYPTTVPTGLIYQYVGSNDSANPAACAGVTVNGTLKTTGFISLTNFELVSGGTYEVVSGTATVAAKGQCKLSGNITIDAGATYVNANTSGGSASDAVNYDQSGMVFTIRGTLSMGNTRWSLRRKSYHEFRLYDGAVISGAGQGANGALDWIESESAGQIDTYGGSVTISAAMRIRSGANVAFWVADGATTTISGTTSGAGTFSKSGANGTLNLTGTIGNGKLTVNEGCVNVGSSMAVNIGCGNSAGYVTASDSVVVTGSITSDSADKVGASMKTFLQTAAKWQGSFVADWAGAQGTQFDINAFGNINSIVEVTKLAGGYVSGSNANVTVTPTVNVSGSMTLNNGYSGKVTTFTKLTGSGTVTINTYTCDITTLDSFTGTLTPTDSYGMGIGTINLTATPDFGAKIVTLGTGANIRSIGTTSVSVNNVVDSTIKLAVVANDGIYRAEAAYGGANYKTLAAAVTAAETAGADPSAVTVYNSAATIPSGYALVTAAGGAMTLRSAGSGELIYWADSNSGDWSGEDSNGTHTFYTAESGTSTTPYVTGDTVVFTSDTQIWSKTAAHGAKFQIGTDSSTAEVHFTRSGSDCDNYILDDSEIEVKSGSVLVVERYSDTNPPTQAYTAWDSYQNDNPDESAINDTDISGAGTVKIGGNTGGHGAVAAVLSGTSTIADTVTVEFAYGATLSVPSVAAFSGSGVVTLDVSDVTLDASGVTLITFTDTTPSDASKFSCSAVLAIENDDLKVYPLAATVTLSDDSVTRYSSVQAALAAVASLGSSAYKYVTAYESATLDYYSANTLKLKTEGVGVVVSLHFPGEYGDFGWVGGEPDDGVVSYTPGPISTVYTWNGGESGNWWVSDNWKFGADYSANRLPTNCDDVIFAYGAEVAVAGNQTVSSITNSAAVTFTAGSAATITASTGGIVLTDVDATITVSNVTLSPTPTTSIAGKMVVGNTNPETSAVTYSVVDIAATISGTPYATLADALAVEGDEVVISLNKNVTGDVVLRLGQTLVLNGNTISGTVSSDTEGIEVVDFGGIAYYCVDNTTSSWIGGDNANWNVGGNWYTGLEPGSATAVTINSFALEESTTTTGSITLPGDIEVKSITLGSGVALTLNAASETTPTLTVTEAIYLTSGQTITLGAGVTLNATLDTNDARSRVVYDSSTKTYSVQVIPGTIFSVY